MSAKLPRTLSRLTIAALAASFALVSDPASARPPRAKSTKRAPKIEKRVVKLRSKHIKRIKARRRGGPSANPGAVAPKPQGEVKFVLSANTPNIPYRGRLIGHYPREWRTQGDSLGPGGEIWLSQNRVPHGSYVQTKLKVEPGYDYEVTLCTHDGGMNELVRATVGGVTHTFEAGNRDCDMTFVLKPDEAGWTTIKVDFAEEPKDNDSNAFAVTAVEVVRR